uniref:Uncharacterized protein n=1 Tax=Arcella intermedia TaxID=1963864 RepID=A0A6B2L9A2_9EUKA|eukprot:TRINITY_DN4354_c0_g1_i1.p1 TRINITY_DN4354_c0_g1~~TRINITY_DN4354_c0_g1_i1.p1  ORF type:complete len:342 (+),score=61.88 TRINITY_DN4354_c0_g1_i1:43-1026(+)
MCCSLLLWVGLLVGLTSYIIYTPQVDLSALKSERILLTGGGSGIGEEMARLAVSYGAHVTITGRRESRLKKVCDTIMANSASTGKCSYVVGDMSSKEDVIRVVREAVEVMGGLDSLILNHVWGVVKYFEDLEFDEITEAFTQTFHANVLGNMWLVHLTLPHLKASASTRGHRSHILHVGSISVTYGVPKLSFYAASKLAMNGFIDAVRMELGPKSVVSLTTANVGAVATDTFKDSLINPTSVELDSAMETEKCARLLLEYMVAEKREVMMPLVDKPFPISGYISWMFPEAAEYMLRSQYNITGAKQGFLKDVGGKPPQDLPQPPKDV